MQKMLVALCAFGIGAATLTGTSIYAPGQDSAVVGRFDVSSGTITDAVDILLAPMTQDTCGTFVEATNLKIDVTMPSDESEVSLGDYCVKNNGRVPIELDFSFFVVESSELSCSAGEAEAGDTTCGTGAGELEFVTYLGWRTLSSSSGAITNNNRGRKFASDVMPGDVVPLHFVMQWLDGDERLTGQSDFLRMDGRIDASAS